MRNVLLSVLVIGGAAILGLSTAFGARLLLQGPAATFPAGMMGQYNWNGSNAGPGMMGGSGMMGNWSNTTAGQRLSLDQITERATQYANALSSNLEVAEVMEFSNNFYAVLQEKDTGRGAMEILLDPYSGSISPEMGPNTMWNTKYGHMGGRITADNPLTLEQARKLAQKVQDASAPGATVHTDGRTFYGYYTIDYDINGKTAGMLSVNGSTGAVWFHTWHGQFIAEKEIIK